MKKLWTAGMAGMMILAGANAGENLIPEGPDVWEKLVRKEPITAMDSAQTAKAIKIDRSKSYELSFTLTSRSGGSWFYVGLIPYDADMRQIAAHYFNLRKNTETRLAKACQASDRTIVLENAAQWTVGKYEMVAFDADDSGNYNDLPNFNVPKAGIVAKKQLPDGAWELTLSDPVGKDWPAGTIVRQHRADAHCMIIASKVISGDATETLGGRFSGFCETRHEKGKFWPGTVYVKPVVLTFSPHRQFIIAQAVLKEVE